METRSKTVQNTQALAKQGLDPANTVHGKRNTHVPNRLDAPPQTYRDRLGNTHFNPGNAEVMRVRMKLSGDSMKDIAQLVHKTGQGGPGSGFVWHHMSDFDSQTGEGTVILMPQNIHGANHHMGGSAQKRAVMNDDPDKKAKYGF